MSNWVSRVAFLPLLVLSMAALSGCWHEDVVYRIDQQSAELSSQAGGFVGYTDVEAKVTVCAACHADLQDQWVKTKHAFAWDTLQASGDATTACEGCHTVGQDGNPVSVPVGFEATGEDRYHDVQCESCHGPGLTHAGDPTASNVPLAAANVGIDLGTGCGECHQGAQQPFVNEWAQSMHAQHNVHAEDNPSCQSCHTGEGALEALGVSTDYVEQASLGKGNHLTITCVVCHDPHGSDNPASLRLPLAALSLDDNLCMKCHQRGGTLDPAMPLGPHSPEGQTLLGTAGWRPPSMQPSGPIQSTHGSEANPKLCATCHVRSFDVTDPSTGDVKYRATGHLFVPIPCIDSDGLPTTGTCADSARSFAGCVSGSCHSSEDVARNLKEVAEQRIASLVTELKGLIAQVPVSAFDATDNQTSVAEGAQFNADLGALPGSAIHNPVLLEALLTASIQAVEDSYGVMPVSGTGVSLQRVLVPGTR